MEFIVRSLVELKLQVEELRRRTEPLITGLIGVGGHATAAAVSGESAGQGSPALGAGGAVGTTGLSGGAAGGAGSGASAGAIVRGTGSLGALGGIEAPGAPPPPNVVTVRPGMTMAEIERAAIEAALRETRGNRRRAAEMLGIGERTLYRKLREYEIPETEPGVAAGVGFGAPAGAATTVSGGGV